MPKYHLEGDDAPQVTLALEPLPDGSVRLTGQLTGGGERNALLSLTTDGILVIHSLDEDFANQAGFAISERIEDGLSRILVDHD